MTSDRTSRYAACISWPRSGHHLLARLLRRAAGPGFKYCAFYGRPECCNAFPCRDPSVNLSKNHDFHLDVPVRDDVWYIVQWRSFLPALVSNFELMVAKNPDQDTAAGFWSFGLAQAERFHAFHSKWIDGPIAQRTLVKYDDFVADPRAALQEILTSYGLSIPARKLDRAIAEVARERFIEGRKVLDTSEQGVRERRDVAAFRHYDPQRFGQLDAYASGTLRRQKGGQS